MYLQEFGRSLLSAPLMNGHLYYSLAGFHSTSWRLFPKVYRKMRRYLALHRHQKNKYDLPPYIKTEDPMSTRLDRFEMPMKIFGYGNPLKKRHEDLRTSKDPFIKKLPVSGKQVNRGTLGGNTAHPQLWGKALSKLPMGVQPVGYTAEDGSHHVVPEMIPEFVVPDLTGFELKPYVSYRVDPDLVQESEFTYKDLFNAVYAPQIRQKFAEENSPPAPGIKSDKSDKS